MILLFTFIPVILWALGSICTSRSAYLVGAAKANSWRLALAALLLGIGVIATGRLPTSPGVWGWLLLSGAIGLGLGDLCMMLGYRRIGPRITVLVLLCLAVPLTGVTEWLWLGTELRGSQALLTAGILAGVGLAVSPGARIPVRNRGMVAAGLFYGVLAAIGQGLGTTISRVAYRYAENSNTDISGISAAWQRMLGGLICALAAEAVFRLSAGQPPIKRAASLLTSASLRRTRDNAAWFWIGSSALLGPVIGLSVYQWVLISVPGALVQAVAALTPVAVIPFAWLIDGDKPDWRGVAGGILACTCAILLIIL